MDLSLASPKLGPSNTPEGKMRDILHNLEEIRGKLKENFIRKEPLEEHRQGKLILFGRGGLNMEVRGGNGKVFHGFVFGEHNPRAQLQYHCGIVNDKEVG